jgi:hypothetical protein
MGRVCFGIEAESASSTSTRGPYLVFYVPCITANMFRFM